MSTYPPAIPIFSVVFPDITDELSVFLFKANPPFSGTSYTFSWISHWLFFPFAPISSFFSYILNHSHHHINISSILKTNLPTNFTFPCSFTTPFLFSLSQQNSPCVVYTCCHQCFSSFETLSSQALLITSPLQLLWSRASVITPLNPVTNSQPSFFLNFLLV